MIIGTLGIILVVAILGVVGASVYSAYTGSVSILKVAGVGGATGILGSITTVFSNAWQFLIASAYGELGWYGYILIFGLVACLAVWGFNAYDDARRNKPIGFVD